MTKQQVRTVIYEGLAKLLSSNGFRLKKSEEGFVRPIPGGQQTIGVPLYDYKPEYEFSLTVCIRLDAVEHILGLFSGSPSGSQEGSYTTITQLEYFTDGAPALFRVITQKDIRHALNGLSPLLRDKIVPFLDTLRDVRTLNKAMNHAANPIDDSLHPYRGMCAVIIAQMAGDPDFDRLAAKYQDEMRLFPKIDKERFEKLVHYLKSHVG